MTINEFFERQVQRHPGKVAVSASDGELTYRELDNRAELLAGHLRRSDVRPGDVVAVHTRRSTSTIVALLGVVKAGGAYLALDQRQPIERKHLVLRGARVTTVLTEKGLVQDVPAAVSTICLDSDWPLISAHPPTHAGAPVRAGHVAYVAYTSGSTGRPKGVCVPHRAVTRLVVDADYLPIYDDDVFLQFAPIAFDASTLEIWGPLLNGARLVMASPEDPSLRELTALVRREGVTVLWLTAGLFHQVVETGLADLRGLRRLLAGGDVLSVPHVNRAVEALPDTTVINGYGPTENTTFSCCHAITAPVGSGTVPIGRPIRGSRAHVLDERLALVPDGEIGELYVAGSGLAHGYLGSPAATAVSFLADPLSDVPGQRMYRTGDLVRRLVDGTFEFHGRRDTQVKIRGFRIELGEVESAAAALSGVAQAVVVAHSQPSGGRRLVAFIVSDSGVRPSTLRIRGQLADVLPSYAVPTLVRVVDALPLTRNGKIDRAVLETDSVPQRPELSAPYREPATPLERAVVGLWADHLSIMGIGPDDDFFELGGHSLLAVEIISDLYREYRVEVSPLSFYLDPTPAGLTRAIERAGVDAEQEVS